MSNAALGFMAKAQSTDIVALAEQMRTQISVADAVSTTREDCAVIGG